MENRLFSEELKHLVQALPDSPGVYQYFNSEGKIIYVGKAKNLKKRVNSYFSKRHEDGKTNILVRQIADIKHIVVESESDALLLENNLIKKYQPRYNILLKDDKSFPWIKITSEAFPRIFVTRQLNKDGGSYYGPYTSVTMVNVLRDLIKELFPIRTCSLKLDKFSIAKGDYKVCLEYHIKNCRGGCVGEESEEEYQIHIESVRNILRGNISSVVAYLKSEMTRLASDLKFEEADVVKRKLESLNNFQSKSVIVSPSISNVDVFSIVEDEKAAYVYFLKVVNGAVVQSHALEVKKRLDESLEEILELAIVEISTKLKSSSREIVVPFQMHFEWSGARFIVPKQGDKKVLLDLATRNATYHRLEKLKQNTIVKRESTPDKSMVALQNALQLSKLPVHIECFDNSNIQGVYPVAACVVFKNGQPSKADYRHFNIKTVEGPNDFASMEEILFRRYIRLIDENTPLPNLIVVDGGKGQLSSAYSILQKLGIENKVEIIGLAKREEEIFFPFESEPLVIGRDSDALRLLQYLRNEAHRFGITFHRNQRSKGFIKSELDEIPNIGDATIKKLIDKFKSVKGIREASLREVSMVVGNAKGQIVFDYFSKKEKI